MATTLLRARVEARRARSAKAILKDIGLKPSDVINMLFAQIVNTRGVPFGVQQDGYAYAQQEYGLTRKEIDRAGKSIRRDLARQRAKGLLTKIKSPDDLL